MFHWIRIHIRNADLDPAIRLKQTFTDPEPDKQPWFHYNFLKLMRTNVDKYLNK
jgi:hypothetical protein